MEGVQTIIVLFWWYVLHIIHTIDKCASLFSHFFVKLPSENEKTHCVIHDSREAPIS